MSRFARQSQGYKVKGQITDCDFVSGTATKDNLRFRNDFSNEFLSNESHTRSDELRARSKFATHSRDRQRTGNHRARRAPQQGAEEKNSTARSATMFAVFLLCVLRATICSRLTPDDGLCAHMDDHRACRVRQVHHAVNVTTRVQTERQQV